MTNRKPMSAEHKAKLVAAAAKAREARAKGEAPEGSKRATLDDQIAAAQAAADAGDQTARALMPVVADFQAQLTEALKLPKLLKKKMRKLLSTLKD